MRISFRPVRTLLDAVLEAQALYRIRFMSDYPGLFDEVD
jgi:hypothetical protein